MFGWVKINFLILWFKVNLCNLVFKEKYIIVDEE